MLEFSAYLAAQKVTQDEVHHARPSSLMLAGVATGSTGFRLVAARQWTSAMLRQLADVIAIMPEVRAPSQPVARHA